MPDCRAELPCVGFDFTRHMRRICRDLAVRLPDLRHVDVDRIAISFSQARSSALHGLLASLTPMRFEGGHPFEVRAGKRWVVEPLYDDAGREMLYILNFYLPRFLNHPFEEKLTTVLHELWHISPKFDGDLRRHEGACYVHGRSKTAYDATMAAMARRWLDLSPPSETYAFLNHTFGELHQRHGAVVGMKVPRRKLIAQQANAT